jgi:hypothetical protein
MAAVLFLGAHIKGSLFLGNSTTILLRFAFSEQAASQNQAFFDDTNSSLSSSGFEQHFW